MRAAGLLRLVAACSLAIVPGAMIVCIGMADLKAVSDPGSAIELLPAHPEAGARRVRAAQDAAADAEEAERLARQMLVQSPLRGSAYATLGQAMAARGGTQVAQALFEIAARRSPRERRTHAWLADHAAGRGDIPRALDHLDQLARLSPGQLHAYLPTIESLASSPETASRVGEWLGSVGPDWRARFLAGWAGRAPGEAQLDAVFAAIRASPAGLSRPERDAWVRAMLRLGRPNKAMYIWLDGLPPDRRVRLGNVIDGGFESEAEDSAFGWRIEPVDGAVVRFEAGAGVVGERALRIDFFDRRVPFRHVQQTLVLPAGAYELTGRVRLDDLQSPRGLRWVVSCDPSPVEIAATPSFSGRSGWQTFRTNLEIPATGCGSQTLALMLAARSPAEQQIAGRVWFDEIRIVRLESAAHR